MEGAFPTLASLKTFVSINWATSPINRRLKKKKVWLLMLKLAQTLLYAPVLGSPQPPWPSHIRCSTLKRRPSGFDPLDQCGKHLFAYIVWWKPKFSPPYANTAMLITLSNYTIYILKCFLNAQPPVVLALLSSLSSCWECPNCAWMWLWVVKKMNVKTFI